MGEILFEKFVDGKQEVFDPSSLGDADKCKYYYKIKDLERWRPRGTLWNAHFGTQVHSGIEAYHETKLLTESHVEAQFAAVSKALELAPSLSGSPDNSRTPNTLCRAVSWYGETWGADDPFKTVKFNDAPAVELRFELAIPGTPWRLSGRIDRLAEWQGDLFIVDIKTTGRVLNYSYWNSWNPSTQFTAYRWACRALGLPVKGVLVEACQTMVNGTRWARQRIDVKEDHINEFERDMVRLVNDVDICHRTEHWPRNRGSCQMYGGCELRDICLASENNRHRYLDDKFHMVPYEPPK